MKKVIFTLFVALVCVSASAQKGKFGVGLNANYSPCIEKHSDFSNFGLSGKLQYNFTDALRGELQAGYDFKNKGLGLFHAAANFHYLINITDKFKFYPIVGIGYGHLTFDAPDIEDIDFPDIDDIYGWLYDDDSDLFGDIEDAKEKSSSNDKLLVNAGVGIEYDITNNFSLGLEVKYQYMKDFNRIPISLGVAYKF